MNYHVFATCLLTLTAATVALPAPLRAQTGGGKNSYRITPPLRVATRPVNGLAPRGVTEVNPFKPRETKEQPRALAVRGYCLVSLRDQQQWLPGSPKIQAILGGKVYLFSSARTRDIFLAAPHLYLPVLDGDCIVTFAETGKRAVGQIEFGLIHGKRVYFFADQDHLSRFQSAPEEYMNADLVDEGACVVSKLLEKRFTPGLPDTVAMVDGRRYFFASAYQRRIFEQNPEPFLVRPLHNPLAISTPNVPTFADVLDVESLRPGEHAGTIANKKPSPLSTIKRSPEKKKTDSLAKESTDHEDFIHNRAMSGYCPVTIRTQNIWRRGKVKFKHTFDGKVYFLAGPEELSAFEANPMLYAPVLGGDSVVALSTDFQRASGSVFHAFIFKERLYLFVSEEERRTFRANPTLFENADLAAHGICMVSRVDDKQEIDGREEFETLYHGKRYRFASADYMQKFLGSPKLYAEE
jgi:YHS domain-containing protein